MRPAALTPKPRVTGVQSATVVGPAGQEIYVDEFGRVRVQFPWDREGAGDHRHIEHDRREGGQREAAPGVEDARREGHHGHAQDVGEGDPGEVHREGELVGILGKARGRHVDQRRGGQHADQGDCKYGKEESTGHMIHQALGLGVAIGGDHDHRHIGAGGLGLGQQLQPAHPRHVDVRQDQDQRHPGRVGNALQRRWGRLGKLHGEAAGAQVVPELLPEQQFDVRFVIDH